jgi:purine-binding chemotaxis protein CheW
MDMEMITFSVGDQEYGADIRSVREVIRPREITPLPRASASLKGVINLRGDVIPIVDLRDKLGLPAAVDAGEMRVIVMELGEKAVGVVVDRVSHVTRVSEDQVETAPARLAGGAGRFVRGVVQAGERLVILLQVEAVLSTDEEARVGEAVGSGGISREHV